MNTQVDNNGVEVSAAAGVKAILAEQVASVVESFGAENVSCFEEVFNFRTSKTLPEGAEWPEVFDTKLDENGDPVNVLKGYKRESFPVSLYRPKAALLATYLQESCPEQELLLEIIEDYVFSAAQKIIGDDPLMATTSFPLDKIAFSVLARMPKEVKTRGLDKAELEAFVADFVDTMPEIIDQSAQWGNLAGNVLEKRFTTIKQDRVAQQKMRNYLDIYLAKAERAEVFSTVVMILSKRLDEMLAADQVDLGAVL